jgi:tyrosine-protein phosphatase non-receptor type 23
LKNSFDVYEDLLAKSQKGLDFYKKLESNINRLLERCRGICKQQAEERQQITDRLKPKGKSIYNAVNMVTVLTMSIGPPAQGQ